MNLQQHTRLSFKLKYTVKNGKPVTHSSQSWRLSLRFELAAILFSLVEKPLLRVRFAQLHNSAICMAGRNRFTHSICQSYIGI